MTVLAVVLAAALPGGGEAPRAVGCQTKACHRRVSKKRTQRKWRRVVRSYGVGRLRARMECESGSHGGYSLYTTGNSFYFAHQFEWRAWTGAGGRVRGGRLVGVWTRHPSRLEQDYRAVVWEGIHGGDPWPLCP